MAIKLTESEHAEFRDVCRRIAMAVSVVMVNQRLDVTEIAERCTLPVVTIRKVLTAEHKGINLEIIAHLEAGLNVDLIRIPFERREVEERREHAEGAMRDALDGLVDAMDRQTAYHRGREDRDEERRQRERKEQEEWQERYDRERATRGVET